MGGSGAAPCGACSGGDPGLPGQPGEQSRQPANRDLTFQFTTWSIVTTPKGVYGRHLLGRMKVLPFAFGSVRGKRLKLRCWFRLATGWMK